MWLTPPILEPLLFSGVVALVTLFVRRKAGWGWLIVVWLGLSVLATGLYVGWIYHVSPLSLDETHRPAWLRGRAFFLLFLILSGLVVWLVSIFVRPRTASEEAPSTGPSGRPEDTHELLGLPRRYQALLVAYREARPQAVSRPWYRAIFIAYVPSYIRQDFALTLQFWRTPDVFGRDFVAAAPVLTALSEMPTARLSALEAYHRVNLKRVRRRLIPVRVIPGALFAVIVGASRLLPSVPTDLAKWDAVQASVLTFVAQPENWGLMSAPVGIVLGLIAGTITAWWMQRRLEMLGELLTVALAHRRLEVLGDTYEVVASFEN